MHRRTFLTGLGAAGALGLLGCGANRTSPAAEEYVPDRGALQVYSAQHQNLTAAWVDAFSAETGVRVQVRKGQDASMGHQIVAEGDASPADVFITENSPAMTLVERAGLLAEVGGSTRQQLLRHLTLSSQIWVPIAARSTVLVYNTTSLAKQDIPGIFDGAVRPELEGPLGLCGRGSGLPGHRRRNDRGPG